MDHLSKGDKKEPVPHGLVETFTATVGLWAFCLGLGMVDVPNGKVKLVFVVFPFPTVLGSPVGQYARQGKFFLLEEGNGPVIGQVGRCDHVLSVIEPYKGHFTIGIDKGPGINAANSFDRTYIVGVP